MKDPAVLSMLGLVPAEPARFRRHGVSGRWQTGRVRGVRADGSLTIHDVDGRARSLRPERVEVRRPGARGRLLWRNVVEVASTWEQLTLW